jgi:hypothetical protein
MVSPVGVVAKTEEIIRRLDKGTIGLAARHLDFRVSALRFSQAAAVISIRVSDNEPGRRIVF